MLTQPTPGAIDGASDELLKKRQLAARLQQSTRTTDDWMRRGKLPYIKVGRTVLFADGFSVNHTRLQWRKEAQRLFGEYRRTGNTEHLKAFRVHRAAMGARLRGRLSNQ